MAFKNEYVPEEDVARHGLDDLYKGHGSWFWRNGRPPGYRHSWTIDRQTGAFLVELGHEEQVGFSGRPQSSTRAWFYIRIRDGLDARILLDRCAESSVSTDERPFLRTWKVLDVDPPGALEPVGDLKSIFTEALKVYGLAGVYQQIPETIVRIVF